MNLSKKKKKKETNNLFQTFSVQGTSESKYGYCFLLCSRYSSWGKKQKTNNQSNTQNKETNKKPDEIDSLPPGPVAIHTGKLGSR